jgi:hypothetical protein
MTARFGELITRIRTGCGYEAQFIATAPCRKSWRIEADVLTLDLCMPDKTGFRSCDARTLASRLSVISARDDWLRSRVPIGEVSGIEFTSSGKADKPCALHDPLNTRSSLAERIHKRKDRA